MYFNVVHVQLVQYFNELNSSHGIYDDESFSESKFDAKIVKIVKCLEKSNTWMNKKNVRTSQLQKTIECKAN